MERLLRSLKSEWLPATGHMSLRGAKRDITYYLMDYYNWWRPHQRNDGIPPAKPRIGLIKCMVLVDYYNRAALCLKQFI